jgi:putative nucleotidyltransferase with HDIG domain
VKELVELEPKLKEILYNCLEQIRATKAALYVSSGEGVYTLVAQYGFRDNARKVVSANDDIVDRLLIKRAPYFVNGLATDPKFSEILYEADTTRLLVAPIYSRGKLHGFLDLRDKAAQQPFVQADSENAQKIAEQFLDFFTEQRMFGFQPVQAPAKAPEEPKELESTALRCVEEARARVDRGGLRAPVQPRLLTDAQVEAGAAVLPGILALPGALVASFSAFSALGGTQILCAKAPLTDEALNQFQAKIRSWLQKRNEPDKVTQSTVEYPYGAAGPRIEPARLITMLTAPVRVENVPAVVLSAAFEAPLSPEGRTLLEKFLSRAEQLVANAIAADALRFRIQREAEKLLEPDFDTYPELVGHCMRVSELAEALANYIGMQPEEIETVRIAGFVHDVGMRMLNYSRLYRKTNPTTDDIRVLREHVFVSAALVTESPLGREIANIVLNHHERVDGTGYPNGIQGEQIPLASRIIHICESFDAMSSPESYQTAVPAAAAVAKIRRAAGTQFDETLAEKFAAMMNKS